MSITINGMDCHDHYDTYIATAGGAMNEMRRLEKKARDMEAAELLCPFCLSDCINSPSDGEFRCVDCERYFDSNDLSHREEDVARGGE